jgi:hypothetical protein
MKKNPTPWKMRRIQSTMDTRHRQGCMGHHHQGCMALLAGVDIVVGRMTVSTSSGVWSNDPVGLPVLVRDDLASRDHG